MPTAEFITDTDSTAVLTSPAYRSLNVLHEDLAKHGRVQPETWAMILDEERTQASEILAQAEDNGEKKGFAAIPRTYYPSAAGLRDIHGQELTVVFDGGVDYSWQEHRHGVPGADWELQRRKTERANLDKIINLPEGSVFVEISATPSDKPAHEQAAQHYSGLTMIRASIKAAGDGGRVRQYNYAIALDSPDFLLAVQTKLGIDEHKLTINSQQLLENPFIASTAETAESSARNIDGLIGAALLETSIGHSATRMLARAVEQRREAWEFINSADNADLEQELYAEMVEAAHLDGPNRERMIKAIRSGFWKELKDRFLGRRQSEQSVSEGGALLRAAATRAVADGDVFIACGDTVKAQAFSPEQRAEMMQKLRTEVKGNGACQACGKKGLLYGCGLCSACNKKWCDTYEGSGFSIQTDPKDLAHRNFTRAENQAAESILDKASRQLDASWRKTKLDWLKQQESMALAKAA